MVEFVELGFLRALFELGSDPPCLARLFEFALAASKVPAPRSPTIRYQGRSAWNADADDNGELCEG